MFTEVRAVLFDLDGTFADTAPDLGAALNRLLREAGQAPLPLELIRPQTSNGARGLLKIGFGITPSNATYAELLSRFLTYYAEAVCVDTRIFEGIDAMLDALETRGIKWGIVTNKAQRFTQPLVEKLGFHQRAACIVSGDSATRPKPHPDPLLLASQLMHIAPAHCAYVGDDLRDVEAGRTAGMKTIVATYGYLGNGKPPAEWGADALISHPRELLALLDGAAC